jgi:hypothetical protein
MREMRLQAQRQLTIDVARGRQAFGERGRGLALALHPGQLEAQDQPEPRPLTGVVLHSNGLPQVFDPSGPTGVELSRTERGEDRGALLGRRWLLQRTGQQIGGNVRCAPVQRLRGGSSEHLDCPLLGSRLTG